VGHLERLQGEDSRFGDLWAEVPRESLLLGALFHDAGKGGDNHAEKGARIAEEVLARWGADPALRADAAFLARHHLLLAETATRRDLGDEAVVLHCAGQAGTETRLKMLYLLAYADGRATGPKAWNDWTAHLLSELFHKCMNILRGGDLSAAGSARRALRTRDEVRSLARGAGTMSPAAVEAFLESLPPRYILAVEPRAILRHFLLAARLEETLREEERRLPRERAAKGLVVLEARPEEGSVWELAVAAKEQPGLFATICGVLSLHGLNIHSADIFTWRDGTVIDVFRVSEPPDPLYADQLWTRVRGAVKFALTGKLALDYRLERKQGSLLAAPEPAAPSSAPQVRVDNAVTDFYTVVEVRAPDRAGLLYDIARTLRVLELEVHVARVATKVDQVVDVFYVRDAFGQKVEDSEHVEEIRRALEHSLAERA
jgi:[protein-PII] uridylyltransferase